MARFVNKIHRRHRFKTLHVFSQGELEDFQSLKKSLHHSIKIIFHLDAPVQLTYHHFVKADILIADGSHFSLTAAYLNENIVYAMPWRIGGLYPQHIQGLRRI